MRKIILSLAMSLDGYILDQKGTYEWIHGDGDHRLDTEEQWDFGRFLDTVDTVVMGRVAYENDPMDFFQNKRLIVATSRMLKNHDNVEFIQGDIIAFAKDMKNQQGKDIFLYGGSLLADAFLKADLIDDFAMGIVPVILGKGKRMFFEDNPTIRLHLDHYYMGEGLPVLYYSKDKSFI